MQIDLEDKVARFVVQEYVNAICCFQSEAELDFDVHKLIHTFQVVEIAKKLILFTKLPLSLKQKQQILNAAVLHDIGRCHEFFKGKIRKSFDHGVKGYDLIRKKFPNLVAEQLSTKWHNKAPSAADPVAANLILDYTRDADILGNLVYNINHMSIFLKHIFQQFSQTKSGLKINSEIISAAVEKRPCLYKNMEKFDFLDMMVAQLGWIYNLRTQAGFLLAKKEKIFSRYRDVILFDILPIVKGTPNQRKKTFQQILDLFPDDLFLREFKKHGV